MNVEIRRRNHASQSFERIDMPLRRKPIRRDGSRSIGAMETVQINRMLGRRAHDVDDFIDAQKSRAKRKTVQLDPEFFGSLLDRKSVV